MPKRNDFKKVLIIGSGPIVIGQAGEFDYSGSQACKALRSLGYQIVLVNSNPATIMTDPIYADATYIEPLNVKTITQIIEKERPDAILPNLGGQTGLMMAPGKIGFGQLTPSDHCRGMLNNAGNGCSFPGYHEGTAKGEPFMGSLLTSSLPGGGIS